MTPLPNRVVSTPSPATPYDDIMLIVRVGRRTVFGHNVASYVCAFHYVCLWVGLTVCVCVSVKVIAEKRWCKSMQSILGDVERISYLECLMLNPCGVKIKCGHVMVYVLYTEHDWCGVCREGANLRFWVRMATVRPWGAVMWMGCLFNAETIRSNNFAGTLFSCSWRLNACCWSTLKPQHWRQWPGTVSFAYITHSESAVYPRTIDTKGQLFKLNIQQSETFVRGLDSVKDTALFLCSFNGRHIYCEIYCVACCFAWRSGFHK